MVEYNPFSYEMHEDPYPTYKALRENAPNPAQGITR